MSKNFVVNRGELKRSKTVQIYDLVLRAEAEQEPFSEVTFITLKSFYKNMILERALQELINVDQSDQLLDDEDNFCNMVNARAKVILDKERTYVSDFVEIDGDLNITICLDVDEITDQVVNSSLSILADINIEPDTRILLGSLKTFTSEEIL